MRGRRIFLAIDISDEALEICAAHVTDLRSGFPEVRVGWERPEKMHVTVKFLGDTTDKILKQMEIRMGEVLRDHAPFPLALSRTGVFPNQSKPRIIWIGLTDTDRRLERLHESVDEVCGELGYEKDTKRFTPHITIGRVREPQHASSLARTHLATDIGSIEFNVSEVVIYESKLQPTGSVYSRVSSIPLLGAQA
jgi:RNA 2',3'-cyclic 3'-phosphodiesterase